MNQPLPSAANDVKIYEPDHSLLTKIGAANLNQAFSKSAVDAAQNTIENASESFLIDCLSEMIKLEQAFLSLQTDKLHRADSLKKIVDTAFKIKTESGVASFAFTASIAKSLQLFAERLLQEPITPKALAIVKWHVDTLSTFLEKRIRGTQSPTENAILRELEKLAVRN